MEEMTITALAHGGVGVGRKDGRVVFVPYTLPGEHILFETLQEKKRYSWGRLVRVFDPSPNRRLNPPCSYFADCGGCHWQHIRDDAQPVFKEQLFTEILQRQGGVLPPRIRPIEASPRPFGYRTSLTLKVRQGRVGFFGTRSHRLVSVERCLLATEATNLLIGTLRREHFRSVFDGNVSELVISAAPGSTSVQVCLRMSSPLTPSLGKRLAGLFEGLPSIASLVWCKERQGDPEWLFPEPKTEALVPFPLATSGTDGGAAPPELLVLPGVFLQANWDVNLIMIREVLGILDRIGPSLRVIELFSGAGNFTVPMGLRGHSVDAFEVYRPSVKSALENIRRYDLKKVKVRCMTAARALGAPPKPKESYDVVVADPPRSGMKAEIARIANLKAPHVVIISCEPATLCRDLNVLTQSGYRLEWSLPLDMFPQTYHVESINYLTR
ncbi:MAG: class I SAM-dependent RNA methyltransferase [Deltaproteobacteria bacterium]|nr:class I SAM-dependent RNA methyltransferase [Deltaproteobacteria bacterium]